jgi:protein transport protein SEC24
LTDPNNYLKGGRISVFSTSLSSLGAGKVAPRLAPDIFNKPEEGPKMMAPAHDYFKYLAQECLRQRICVDLYFGVGPKNTSIDLTTIAPIAGITGGDVRFYQNFDVVKHGDELYFQMFRALTRPVVTDVELKARCSTGLTVTEYIGGQMSS